MLSSLFLRTISSSPRSLCSPKPYLSRQKSHLCRSFERIIMNRGKNSRGGTRNSRCNAESTRHRDQVQDGFSQATSAARKDGSFRSRIPQQVQIKLENAATDSSKDSKVSPSIGSSNERSSLPSFGVKGRIPHNGWQHGSTSPDREAGHQSSELPKSLTLDPVSNSSKLDSSNEWPSLTTSSGKGRTSQIGRQHGSTSTQREAFHQSSELPQCLPMMGSVPMIGRPQHRQTSPDLVVGHHGSEHHKPLPVVQDACSQDACFGIKDRSSKNERPQSRHSSPESVGSHYISEHPEASSIIVPFDIFRIKTGTPVKLKPPLLEKNREKRKELDRTVNSNQNHILRSGMVLLKNYISHRDQIKILKTCRNLGLGYGGFYQPGYADGAKLRLQMMCLGKNWEPQTREYVPQRFIDNAEAPPIPPDFKMLVKRAIEESHKLIRQDPKVSNTEQVLPWMNPDVCIVNFYSTTGKLGLHQDRDESSRSLDKKLPVVSFSIGDKAEFLYGDTRDVDKAENVELESGDVLIFGGDSRHIFHGVTSIAPDSAPKSLVDESDLRPGRLNLTFREY